jgi:hypothetical protein
VTAIRALPPALFAVLFAVLLAAAPPGAPFGYCYRTLADVVCYLAPDRGREARFTGSYPLDSKALPSSGTAPVCAAEAGNAAAPRDLLAGAAGATSPPCTVPSPPR